MTRTVKTVRRYRFTVDQYHRMGDAGIFHPDCRVELINGQIFEMSPIDPWPAGVVDWLTYQFTKRLQGLALVRVQNPATLDRYSEPQPDVMLIEPRADFYRMSHPTPDETLLVIEVSNTSLRHDLRRKVPLYARRQVSEVWVVNRHADAVDVFRVPTPEGYDVQFRRGRGESLTPAAFPDVSLSVDELLGPPISS